MQTHDPRIPREDVAHSCMPYTCTTFPDPALIHALAAQCIHRADVAYSCMPYHLPRESSLMLLEQPLAPGIPTEQVAVKVLVCIVVQVFE